MQHSSNLSDTRNFGLLILFSLVLIFTTTLPFTAAANDDFQAVVGETFLVKFQGSSGGGSRWIIKEELSRGTDLVSVEEVGWTFTAQRTIGTFRGKPGVLSIAIIAKRPGEANLVFHYVNPNMNRPRSARTIRVTIDAASAAIN